MSIRITTINLGGVNSYLADCGDGFVLIDAAFSAKRKQLVGALNAAGCTPGRLKLLLLTHGDVDHTGNAAFFQREYKAKVAMHADDVGMAERGDMGWNRKRKSDSMSVRMKVMMFLVGIVLKKRTFETFTPDILVDEGFDLSKYGLDAQVVCLPGHSKGSIGVLTREGDLYCGDFLYGIPGLRFVDNAKEHDESAKKLRSRSIRAIYPGHGKPFGKETVPRLLNTV